MSRTATSDSVGETDDQFQRRMLAGVSRTFALTIPELPTSLFPVVANAYLLCRIADTIEDDSALNPELTRRFSEQFIQVVDGEGDAREFASELVPLLSGDSSELEHELIGETPRVIGITHGFNTEQRAALLDCVTTMSRGMAEFSATASRRGLSDQAQMDRYCYVVAGVVGECLTRLFSVYSDRIALHHDQLMHLSVSFGQGLQMTNILKDVWSDHERGVCWLPRDAFTGNGCELERLPESGCGAGFRQGLQRMLSLARMHLQDALDYVKLLPRSERGLRNFCLWAIGMAVLTLKRIHANPDYRSAEAVKISRREVYATVWGSRLIASSNALLQLSFDRLCAELPSPVRGLEAA